MKRNLKLWTCVHELKGLHDIAESKYILSYSNWNDFGFQTLCTLHIALPEHYNDVCNVPIAYLSIVENYPKITRPGERFLPIEGNTNFTSFIMSIESAECMYLTLTHKERMELVSKLHIKFNDSGVSEQENYRSSTLRRYNHKREDFLAMQQKIEKIMHRKNNISRIVRKYFALTSQRMK